MKTGLRKTLPQKRRIQRPAGAQDLSVGAAPKFGRQTVIQGIINVQSISSHSYIKEASEGYGLAIWKQADNKYALAIDKIYLRKGGNLQTIATEQLPSSSNYVNIKQNEIFISRVSTTGEGAALSIQAPGSNSNGITIATVAGSSGNGIRITIGGSGDCLVLTSVSGRGIYCAALAEIVQNLKVGTSGSHSLFIREKNAAVANIAAYGQIWTKNNAGTGELWFTDPAGTSTKIV